MDASLYNATRATRPFHLVRSTSCNLHWAKADLHIHTSEDPMDEIDYSALELVEGAHDAGLSVCWP